MRQGDVSILAGVTPESNVLDSSNWLHIFHDSQAGKQKYGIQSTQPVAELPRHL